MRCLRKLNCAVCSGNPSLSAEWLGDNLQWVTKAGGWSRLQCADRVSPSGYRQHVLCLLQFQNLLSSLLPSGLLHPEILPPPGDPSEGPPQDTMLRGREEERQWINDQAVEKDNPWINSSSSPVTWASFFTSLSSHFLIWKMEIQISTSQVGSSLI